jgi:hypothetical protein
MSDVEKETWVNNGAGDVFVVAFDHQGQLVSIPVRAGKKVLLSVQERQINQEQAYTKDVDMFSNGRLTPLKLVDTAEDYIDIANNPNHLSEDDMRDIFKLKGKAFAARIAEITNVLALKRMHEIAADETNGVSMASYRALEKRISEVEGIEVLEIAEIEKVD